jgi:hypothetical protein
MALDGVLREFNGDCSGGNRLNSLYFSLLQGIWQRGARSGLDPPPYFHETTKTIPPFRKSARKDGAPGRRRFRLFANCAWGISLHASTSRQTPRGYNYRDQIRTHH